MDLAEALARAPLFAQLPPPLRERLHSAADRLLLPAGQRLYAAGDPPDSLYLVIRGRLRVSTRGQLLGYVGRLEPVGETGVLRNEPRSVDVHALRDTEPARIPAADLLAVLREDSAALLELTRLIIGRLRSYQGQRRNVATDGGGTLAVIPASDGVPAAVLAQAVLQRLSGWPRVRLVGAAHVDAALGPGSAQTPLDDGAEDRRLRAWLGALEERHPFVIFAADSDSDTWSRRCLRQADRVLLLAEAQVRPDQVSVVRELRASGFLAPLELVLLRADGDPAPYTLDWCRETGARAHYFVHPWAEDELAALARQVTGRGVGVVLGGGGARGFAHIGLVRALEQLEIPVDVAGGTSMGAFVSAMLACGFDSVEMVHISHETFVTHNFLNDYTVPRVSLIRGGRFHRRLTEIFGERRIEELRRTYYCISTNLTTGASVVHDRGPLATWVGTSMCIPGIAPPVAWEGELLCDGGVVNNLPTDVMLALERGAILASNVSTEGDIRAPGAGVGQPDPGALLQWKGEQPAPRLAEILMRTATLTSDTEKFRDAAARADVFLRMPIAGIGLFEWNRLDELVAATGTRWGT